MFICFYLCIASCIDTLLTQKKSWLLYVPCLSSINLLFSNSHPQTRMVSALCTKIQTALMKWQADPNSDWSILYWFSTRLSHVALLLKFETWILAVSGATIYGILCFFFFLSKWNVIFRIGMWMTLSKPNCNIVTTILHQYKYKPLTAGSSCFFFPH